MTRILNEKESNEAGYAVGTMLVLVERLMNGELDFTEEQLEQIVKASETFSKFTEEEQLELIELGLKRGNK